MENRERDRMSERSAPTNAGRLNRETEEARGSDVNSGTSAEFGQSIGRSENLEQGETMRRDRDESSRSDMDKNVEDESYRRERSGAFGTETGRSGSFGHRGGGGSDIARDEELDRRGTGESGSTGESSRGRH